ncbi:MAG: metalloregulator ArsR/SmtB family transcription factor [Candidatus Thermoplasmatota archaeon]
MEFDVPEEVEDELEQTGGIMELMKGIDHDEIEDQSEIYKALSKPLRLKILTLLDQQDLCVCLLKEMLDIKDSKLSYHLSVLKDVGLIEGHRKANFVIYRITEKGKNFSL